MKKSQRNSFKLNPIAASIVLAMASQLPANVAYAGSGWGNGVSTANAPVNIQTYYANSPSGPAPGLTAGAMTIDAVTQLPIQVDSGKALRKFVDTLPGITGITSLSATTPATKFIPVAVPEKWVNLNGVTTGDDYYEIAAVEYTEQMHSDLVKPTHLRGYVQLMTPGLAGKVTATSFTTLDGRVLSVVAAPNHLGPIISATKGTAVRVKFINYLPIGTAGNLFLPVDTTITGAGLGPDGVNSYTQNRTEMHLVGGQAPWISAGSPHQWVAPASQLAADGITSVYDPKINLGKGASTQNVPDMADPGPGATTLYFPNDMSARFTLYEDRSAGITRLNTYAGLEAGYFVTDTVESTLSKGGTLTGGTLPAAGVAVAAGTIPVDQIPLIIEDKTFVPADIAQQDALWDTTHWGQPGDLWFPHVYEANQGTGIASGVNPVGRWDFGPNFWPIFAASQPLPTGGWDSVNNVSNASFVPEAYMDTPVVNGVAYPTVTVDPKAYRFRILNASNDRFINLGLYKAAPDFIDTVTKLPTATASATTVPIAPQLDQNGNPVIDATGKPLYFSGSEVRLLPAVAVDAAGTPATPSPSTAVGTKEIPYDPTCLCQYPALPQLLTYAFSGPTRAWPIDSRMVPDPASVGPDFIAIGNDGGLLPNPVDIPSQPITYEANRRSVTVTNVYGYGLLVGPQERADAVVDFTPYANQTLILYNDAPTPFPFDDNRVDYFTGDPDQTGTGGAYSTKPGYGPNTRTVLQIKVNPAITAGSGGGPLNVPALAAALPAAYAASQPMPLVPETAYNAAFGTTDTDNYGRVATGSAAQPTLDFVRSASVTGTPMTITGINIVSSTGPGSGSGTGYMAPPLVSIVGGLGVGGVPATAHSTVNAAHQVATVVLDFAGSGYTSQPSVVFTPTGAVNTIVVADGGTGYTAPVVTITGGGATTNATASAIVTTGGSPVLSTATVSAGGSGYAAAPSVSISGGGGSGATATATVSTSTIAAAASLTAGGSGFSLTPTVTFTGGNGSGAAATVTAAYAISPTIAFTGGTVAYDPLSTTVTISAPTAANGVNATATATVDTNLLSATLGQIIGVTVTNPGSGYTAAPTVTITDGVGNLTATATATASLAAGTGVVTGLTVTSQGTGYTSAPTINFVDATGKGAVATTTLAGTAGVVTAVNITNAGKGYTTAPTITITDPNGKGAVATVGLVTPAGTITGITINTPGSGYTSAPTVTIADPTGTGTGATANATILAAGNGAQATIVSTNTGSIVTLTKAEQELFDAHGRYNSTGGSELPYTTAAIQTTVPLQYVDTPTEIIGDSEAQVWKIVDNGFWSNSIHFDMNDVQLINRVGWDGTVKAPANNEVGWKDTVRLNPLEDVIVVMRAKQASVPFGQPQSTRLQDPTLPANAAGIALAAGLPAPARFTADVNVISASGLMAPAGVQLITTAINSPVVNGSVSVGSLPSVGAVPGTGNFDNEFTWGTAVLGHAEDDFQRPVVFNPNVVIPDAPSALADTTSATAPAGTVTLSWVDPTPPGQLASAAGVVPVLAATSANPKNELGFKILRADVLNGVPSSAFVQVATVPANATSWTTTAAALAALTPPVNPAGAFEVVAYNVAGASTPSNVLIEGIPVAPNALMLTPGFITPATNTSDVNVTATWQDNSNNETSYVTTRSLMVGGVVSGTPLVTTLPANIAPPSTTTTWVDAGPLVEASIYKYDVVAKNNYGSSTPVLTGTITAPISVPLAPAPLNAALVTAVPNVKAANVALTWTDLAFNETGYTVSRIGGAGFTTVILSANSAGYVDTTAQEGNTYTYNVCATNLSIAGVVQSGCTTVGVTSPVTIPLQPTDLTATSNATPLDSNGLYPDSVTLKWTDKAFNETGYQVLRGGVVIGTVTTSAAAGTAMSYVDPVAPAPSNLLDGHAYSYAVAAINSANPVAPVTVAPVTSNAAPVTMLGLALPAPLSLVATPNRAGAFINLTWANPASTAALPITGALVQEQVTNAAGVVGPWINVANILPAGTTTLRRTAAVVGNIYNFRVAEVNVAQKSDSAYTYINATLTSPTLPATPVLANLAPVPNVTNGSVALSWAAITPITGTTMSYIVNVTVKGVTTSVRTNRVNYTFRPTAAQVGTGATFSFTIQAVQTAIVVPGATLFGSATSAPSAAASVTLAPAVAPAALAGVTATVASATQATLAWTDNSTVETSYLVTILNTTTGTTTTATINRTTAQTTGSGTAVAYNAAIVVGNSYKFTVVAQNTKYGVTIASAPVSTTLTVPTVPAAPTVVSVTQGAVNSRAITVTWADAATNVTGYTIQRATVSALGAVGAYANVGTTTAAVKTFTNTGLTIGTRYSYQVRANSLVGNSAFVVMGQATAR